MRRAAYLLLPLLLTLLFSTHALAQTVTGNVVPSRTSGVAPLYVFFDATATTCGGGACTRPYDELHYAWQFDLPDPNAVWATTGKLKNIAYGPVAAMVFDTAGTYDVSVTITAKGGATDTEQVQITVTDPDTVWSGSNTICFSTSGTFDSGCPASATKTTTSSLATIEAACTGAKRCLLRRGEQFSGGNLDIGGTGPGMLSDFGPAGNSQPLIQHSGSPNRLIDWANNTTDWRVVDVRLQGNSNSQASLFFSDDAVTNILIQGCTNVAQSSNMAIEMGSAVLDATGNDIHQGIGIFENTFHDFGFGSGGNIVFTSSANEAVIGNSLTDTTSGEHIGRYQHYEGLVVSNNIMGPQNGGRSIVSLRSSDQNGNCSAACGRPSREVVVSDNIIINASTSSIGVCGVNKPEAGEVARCDDTLIERNYFKLHTTLSTSDPVQNFCCSGGSGTHSQPNRTFRNNVMNMTGTMLTYIGAREADRFYNNTCYSPSSGGAQVRCFRTATEARNNLCYMPGSGGSSTCASFEITTATNNVTASSNPFAQSSFDEPADFELSSGAGGVVAKDAGTNAAAGANPLDWHRFTRLETATPDAGAFDESTVAGQVPDPPDPNDPPDPLELDRLRILQVSNQATLFDTWTGQQLDRINGFAIEAMPGELTPGSVRFTLDCTDNSLDGVCATCVQNSPPYLVDEGGMGAAIQWATFATVTLPVTCSLTVEPFSLPNAAGTEGTNIVVPAFTVVDTTPPPQPVLNPPNLGGARITGGRTP